MQSTLLPLRLHGHLRQQGVALFVVIVFVMLSMLLALWASRTSLFNEMVVGNDADYQRAFEAAQALLQDAELDIRGETPNGGACTGSSCRNSQANAYKIPLDPQEVTPLLALLDKKTSKCFSGLCVKRAGRQDFWNTTASTSLSTDETTMDAMTTPASPGDLPPGARYGQYTGATVGDSTNPANPILADTSARDRGGWYWIEILRYDESSKNSGLIVGGTTTDSLLRLNLKPSVAYRITALAYGRKAGTMAVLQQTYVRQIRKD